MTRVSRIPKKFGHRKSALRVRARACLGRALAGLGRIRISFFFESMLSLSFLDSPVQPLTRQRGTGVDGEALASKSQKSGPGEQVPRRKGCLLGNLRNVHFHVGLWESNQQHVIRCLEWACSGMFLGDVSNDSRLTSNNMIHCRVVKDPMILGSSKGPL